MYIVTHRKLFFTISSLLILGSIVAGLAFGLHFGTDFTGGSLIQVTYTQGVRPTLDAAKADIVSSGVTNLDGYQITESGTSDFILRARTLTPAERTSIETSLAGGNVSNLKEDQFSSVGPVVGASLKTKSYYAIAVVVLCIVLFVTFAFRKVSEPVPSWKFGLATIVALAHDVIIPTGVYIVFCHFTGAQIDLLFVTALLAILGYSVHDTIVVFDRVREHLRLNSEYRTKEDFETTVGKSVRETFGRSINTSFTIFIVLMALFLIGSPTTQDFAFVLLIGVITGTYSSIFIASPLLVTLEKMQEKKAGK